MRAELVLIRHAETRQDPSRNSRDWVLTERTYAVCERLAEDLRSLTLTRIVTSEEVKAKETGRLVAEALDIPCESAPGLEEHHRQGVPFMEPEEWRRTLKRFFAQPDALVFGQETAGEAGDRFGAALEDVLNEYPNERLGVVSHASVMALFVTLHNGRDAYDFWKTIGMPDALRLSLPGFRLLERRESAFGKGR